MKKIDRRSFAASAGLGVAGAFATPLISRAEARLPSPPEMKLRPLSKGLAAMLPKMMALANVPGVGVAYVENVGSFVLDSVGTRSGAP